MPNTNRTTNKDRKVAKKEPHITSRSGPIAAAGIKTSMDFANLMSALITDLVSGATTPQIGNAICNAGGKLLKVVELEQRYGSKGKTGGKTILLAEGDIDATRPH